MSRFDGTGPNGRGSMTGKGMGYCIGTVIENPMYGRGLGRINQNFRRGGRGMARGLRCGFKGYSIENPKYLLSDKESLQSEKAILEMRLNSIKEELETLSDK